jgi:hypothetical protein
VNRYHAALLLISVLAVGPAPARAQSVRPNLAISPAMRSEVIAGVIREVETKYVFEEPARRMARLLRERQRSGKFDAIDSAAVLCTALTATLHEVRADEHLRVDYSFRAKPMPRASDAATDSAAESAQRRQGAMENFGFARVERMRGNVGYLDLRRFAHPEGAGETAAAAMAFLANTEAMIIDLRENGGGYGEMVNLLTTYFLTGEPVHLRDVYDRGEQSHLQAWTLPYVPGPRYTAPLFILVGPKTFSAAESFAYGLKNLKRAKIVGERTRGGAHPTSMRQINEHFAVFVPHARVVDVATKGDWEGTGVAPDMETRSDWALAAAHVEALRAMRALPQNAGDDGLDDLIRIAGEDLERLRRTK